MKPAILTLTLLLAGCANKSANPKVRIATIPGIQQSHFLAIPLAQALGYFTEEGLDVTLESLGSSTQTMQALLGGSAEAAAIGYLQTIQMAAEGQHVRAVYISANRTFSVVVLPPSAKDRIQTVSDLKGKLIGIPSAGSPTSTWVQNYLAKHSVNAEDFKTIAIGGGSRALAALEHGSIDAACMNGGDHIRYLDRNPTGRLLVDGSSPQASQEVFGGLAYAGSAVGVRQDWLDRNPDVAGRMVRALHRAHLWIRAHSPSEIRARLPSDLRSDDEATDLAVLQWILAGFTPDGKMPTGAPEAVVRFLSTTNEKIRDTKIDLDSTWTNDFLPNSK